MMNRKVKFLRDLIETRPAFRAIGRVAEFCALQEGIGRVKGSRVLYSDEDFEAARHLLTSHGYEVEAQPLAGSRSQTQPGDSEKWGSQRVSHNMVAVVSMGIPGLELPDGSMLCIDAQKALSLPYEVLVFCENLEPMQLMQSYGWLAQYIKARPALALFRGAPGYFRSDVAHEMLALDNRPVLAFFDFDPKGLSMAASVPRREALCLPPRESLEDAVKAYRRRDLYFRSVDVCRVHLAAQPEDSDVAQAWALMNGLEMALDQEHFPQEPYA
jgi:hypothetical protein